MAKLEPIDWAPFGNKGSSSRRRMFRGPRPRHDRPIASASVRRIRVLEGTNKMAVYRGNLGEGYGGTFPARVYPQVFDHDYVVGCLG